MSIIGPRPLLVEYLPLYNEQQKHRHDVRPGLSGLAQAHGRNTVDWEKRFVYDVEYTEKLSFLLDVRIVFTTLFQVFQRKGINSVSCETMEKFMGQSEMIGINTQKEKVNV